MEKIQHIQMDQRRQLYEHYQEELKAATTPAEKTAVTNKYKLLLQTNRSTLSPNVPLKQQLKQRKAELEAHDRQLDYWRKGDYTPSVTSITDEAAYDKGVETFKNGSSGRTMEKVMDAQRQRLQQSKPRL